MSRTRLCSLTALALLLVAISPYVAAAQGEGRTPPTVLDMPPELRAAQTFLFAAYPELTDRPLAITLNRTDDGVAVSVVEDTGPVDSARPLPPLLTASFVYDADVQLQRYDAHGPLVHDDRNLALQDELLAHPRWIDSDADVWLTRQGARSTIGTAFLPPRPQAARALEQQLGASRTTAPPRFLWYQDGADAGPAFRARPAWVIDATRSGLDGESAVYRFEYEPFGGQLIAVVREGDR